MKERITDTTSANATPESVHARPSAAPLTGVRIIAVEQYGAGPFGTLYLADLGAEIIKVEDPSTGGDVSRYIPPGRSGTDSLFHEAFNRGKRSVALDLKSTSGRALFERLVASADAVYSNLRGDQPSALGLRYEDLSALNPAIVCVALTGWGETGEDAMLPAYDALIQAASGWAALTGDPAGPPTKSGLSLADYIAGLTSALGLMVALFDARRTGRGRDVRVNLYDSALAMLSYPATWYLSSGFVAERHPNSAHPSIVPFQFFPTADGHIAVACPKEKFFTALVEVLEVPWLGKDPRFRDFDARSMHRAELVTLLTSRFQERATREWLAMLRGVVPVAPVRSLEQALAEDELRARGMLAEYEHKVLGTVRSIGLPMEMDGHVPTYRPAPTLGGDQDDILGELGLGHGESLTGPEGGGGG